MSPPFDAKAYLEELQRLLESPLLPVQAVIASALGVDQPFVSNAYKGKLKRVTDRVRELHNYAKRYESESKRAAHAAGEIDRETKRGGPARLARAANRPAQAEDAIADLNTYLDDGYDPRLIVEQLAVLRRAQQVRRPGRKARHEVSASPR